VVEVVVNAVDLFAGLGGFTEGAERAGASVVWAANHWRAAVDIHAANHPRTQHECQDLQQADWTRVPTHDLLLASPACQGHSSARGKEKPHHDALRSTAWAVVSAAEACRPRALIVENVERFRKWALFPFWSLALQALGYRLSEHVIDAADCGVPQNRRRLFVVGLRNRKPMPALQPKAKHIPIGDVVRFDRGEWSPVDKPGRAPATLARVADGRRRYGAQFVMPYYSLGSGITGRPLDRPVGTITTISRWALVDHDRMRMLLVDELRAAMGFRADYVLPAVKREAEKMLGNAVAPPVAEFLVRRVAEAVA
jgi:DNA (cytosine-5)-methyltransferase 1